jgi:hypothetical protein
MNISERTVKRMGEIITGRTKKPTGATTMKGTSIKFSIRILIRCLQIALMSFLPVCPFPIG